MSDPLMGKLQDCMDHIQEIMGPDNSPEESRELAICYTKVEEALLWRARDLAIKDIIAKIDNGLISSNESFND